MSTYRVSTSTPTTSLVTAQVVMKEKIFEELESATFTVALTAWGSSLQADPDNVQMVANYLQHSINLTYESLFGDEVSTEGAPRLPPRGFSAESDSYRPFTHLLNIIVLAVNTCLTRAGYLKDLHFEPYDVQMANILDSGTPLKPDILGLFRPRTSDGPNIFWEDVAVIIEVKGHSLDIVKQLATYARNHLSLNRRRSFSIAIAIDHKALTLRFLCFHRSGVSASELLKLKEKDGFRSAVEHMVGIASIRDEAAFGLDMTRVKDVYCLNSRYYDIVRTIQNHDSIRGRATAVYSLKLRTTDITDFLGCQSRELTLVDGESQLPEKVVYKLSYQAEGHPSEGSLLSGFRNQFGIVDIIGYHVCTVEESFGSTAHHLSNAQIWQLANDRPVLPPEIKQLHCTAMALEGLPLLDTSDEVAGIPTPAGLVETILHSMIGHYNLFLGGILHRDVSSGNILRLREPIDRAPGLSMSLLNLHDRDVKLCRGFLVDGDRAIKWCKDAITPSLERSGTLPFVSIRLLSDWRLDRPVLHTAIDDLESFLWVLVWSLVHVFKKFAKITNKNSVIYDLGCSLSSRDFAYILVKKDSAARWTEKVFKDLIKDWLRISEQSQAGIDSLQETLIETIGDSNASNVKTRVFDELDKRCRKVYKKFIQSGFKHLKTIRKFSNWEDVVGFSGEELLNE